MRPPRELADPPDLPAVLEAAQPRALDDGQHLAGCALANLDLGGQDARGVRLEASTLDAVDLSSSRLHQISLVDVRLTGGALANVVARGARGVRAEITGSRLTGLDLREADLHDVVFRRCRIDLASFGRARLEHVWFDDCVLREADFGGARLRAVRFADCDLTGADFREARPESCAMRGVRLDDVQGLERLRGTTLAWPDVVANAATFATALGLRAVE